MDDKNIFEDLIKSSIIIIFSATISALLNNTNSIVVTIRKWSAGIMAGFVSLLLLDMANISQFYKGIIMIVVSAFISSIWPIFEAWAKRKANKITNGQNSV